MQGKKKITKKQSKVRDLKPKKDAKGGIIGVLAPRGQQRPTGTQGPRPNTLNFS